MIGRWLGHESLETTQMYLNVDLKTKEEALAKLPEIGKMPLRFKADDRLLSFLNSL